MKKRKLFLGVVTLIALCTTACSFKFAGSSDSSFPALNSSSVTSSKEDGIPSSSSLNQPSSSSLTPTPSSSSQGKSSSSSLTPSSSSNNPTSTSASSSRPSSSSATSSSSSNKPSSSSSNKPSSSSSSNKPSSTSNPASSSSNHSSSSNPASSSSNPSSSSGSSSSSSQQTKPDNASFEIFAFNDTHGNVRDTEGAGLGIAKTTTVVKELSRGKNAICISQGDMWQGSIESNYTHGNLVTEWMNSLNFVSMTVGNHEYDWGKEAIIQNSQLANFPTLGINVLNKSDNKRVDYLEPSTTFTRAGVKFGVIGAIGNCLSSISASKVQGITFATGDALTNLVKAESIKLRQEENCDFIIYSIHGSASTDLSLSNEHYVDLVLEGHTHQNYAEMDDAGVYHVQCYGDNRNIYQITVDMNFVTNSYVVTPTNINLNCPYSPYANYQEDSATNALFQKYYDSYSFAYATIGQISEDKDANQLRTKAAELYLSEGLEKWGGSYPNIILGGGYMSCRSPYYLPAGEVTYSQLASLFPFDNDVVLCSVLGSDLRTTQFIRGSSNYFVDWTSYGESIKNDIQNSETYYLVTDTYSSDYYMDPTPNESGYTHYCPSMVVIDALQFGGRYARDLLADYIAEGNWYIPPEPPAEQHEGTIDDPKTIAEGLAYAEQFPADKIDDTESVGYYYVGVVSQLPDSIGGSGDLRNVHVKDADKDNDMTIYYLKKHEHVYDIGGNWDSLDDLSLGDVIVFWGRAFFYKSRILEFASGAYAVSINGVPTY